MPQTGSVIGLSFSRQLYQSLTGGLFLTGRAATPYFLTYGAILNKLAADLKASDKLTFGGALLYVMTAEDLPNGEDTLGTEVDAYVSYKLYPNVEVALNAGYLFADKGMGFFTEGGEEENIFRSTARVRYTF